MKKPFDALYAGLEAQLERQENEVSGPERFVLGLRIIRDKIVEMRDLARSGLDVGDAEVEYFRQVWPAFFGKYFLYIQLHRLELERTAWDTVAGDQLLDRELDRVGAFFRANHSFWAYYRSGSLVLDVQFTREYSRARLFDPLSLVIDAEWATLASYRAAWCLAMEGYRRHLVEMRDQLREEPVAAGDYSWGAADVDFIEWIYGLQAVGAIQYKGQPADIGKVAKWARRALGKEVPNMYDRFSVLRNRKKERQVFTKRISEALAQRMDQADGR